MARDIPAAEAERLRTELFRRHANAEAIARDGGQPGTARQRHRLRAEVYVEVIALLNVTQRGEPYP